MNKKKIRKRCPNCKSADIYKRCRILESRRDTRGKIPKKIKDRKAYKCRNCKNEFDVPISLIKKYEKL